MPAIIQTVATSHPHVHVRPLLDSFDSAEECSFRHWLEVCQLVDEGNGAEGESRLEFLTEADAEEITRLKMQSSAADEHLTGHVVR